MDGTFLVPNYSQLMAQIKYQAPTYGKRTNFEYPVFPNLETTLIV